MELSDDLSNKSEKDEEQKPQTEQSKEAQLKMKENTSKVESSLSAAISSDLCNQDAKETMIETKAIAPEKVVSPKKGSLSSSSLDSIKHSPQKQVVSPTSKQKRKTS